MDAAIEAGAVAVVVIGLSYVFFKILNALKLLRVAPADELTGLDMPEMGTPGYTTVDVRMTGGGRLSQQAPRTRTASAPAKSPSTGA